MSNVEIVFLIAHAVIICSVALVGIITGLCWTIPMYLRLRRNTEKK